jgi:hypothetical protein
MKSIARIGGSFTKHVCARHALCRAYATDLPRPPPSEQPHAQTSTQPLKRGPYRDRPARERDLPPFEVRVLRSSFTQSGSCDITCCVPGLTNKTRSANGLLYLLSEQPGLLDGSYSIRSRQIKRSCRAPLCAKSSITYVKAPS